MSDNREITGEFWIAVNAYPNRELVAAHHLRNQNYEPYVPVLRKQIRHARRVQDVLRPLFPGYLFVHIKSAEMRWRPILSTVGVRSVVCIGDTPCAVPDQLIDELRARQENGVIVRAASAREIGDTVRIALGPFDGLVGTIIGLSENDRLVVLMDFLNRPVRVKVSGDLLSVAYAFHMARATTESQLPCPQDREP